MKNKSPLIVILVTLVLVLIAVFINKGEITFFDSWFYGEMAERISPRTTVAMKIVTDCGSSIPVIVLCLSLFLFPKLRKKWALPIAIGVSSSALINLFLKSIIERPRPNVMRLISATDYSFPSGHAMINMTLYATILFLTWYYIKNKPLKYGISIVCLIMPIAIGISRIYLGVHYATDVIAGWTLGFIIAAIVYSVIKMNNEAKK